MKSYLLDAKPNFGEVKVTIEGLDYQLKRVKGNGCIFTSGKDGLETDSVVFTMQACKALFCLLTINDCK
jgi:hypothetical protein